MRYLVYSQIFLRERNFLVFCTWCRTENLRISHTSGCYVNLNIQFCFNIACFMTLQSIHILNVFTLHPLSLFKQAAILTKLKNFSDQISTE